MYTLSLKIVPGRLHIWYELYSSITSRGVFHPNRFIGRLFTLFSTIAISSSEIKSKFVFLGKNADIPVFDLYLDYSIDDKIHPIIWFISLCKTFSVPLSYVMLFMLIFLEISSIARFISAALLLFSLLIKTYLIFLSTATAQQAFPPRNETIVSTSRSPIRHLSLIILGRCSIPTRSEILVFAELYRFLYLRPAHGFSAQFDDL